MSKMLLLVLSSCTENIIKQIFLINKPILKIYDNNMNKVDWMNVQLATLVWKNEIIYFWTTQYITHIRYHLILIDAIMG